MLGQIGLGRLAQVQSIAAGYVVGGSITVLMLPVVVLLRRLNEPADIIIGTAPAHSACAAQGLPNVAAIDTNTTGVATVEA